LVARGERIVKKYRYIGIIALLFSMINCGSVAREGSSTIQTRGPIIDSDNDYISDEIENLIGSDPYNSDQNANGILDGVDTQGEFGDTFFDKQWYIRATSVVTNSSGVGAIGGNDLNLLPIYQSYMGYNGGNPIIIQVVDAGVYAYHEDLVKNIDLTRSYDGLRLGKVALPLANNPHGTKVAGVIAARAFNGMGVRGVIPFAKIALSNWLSYSSYAILDKAWYSGAGANDISVSNNSWGFGFSEDTIFEEYMQKGSTLRDGKGRIYVFPSGNSRVEGGNANLQYMLNNRFAITVSSINYDNKVSSFSSRGSNIITCAYSGENKTQTPTIATTTIPNTSYNSGLNQNTWSEDVTQNYTYDFDGTSTAVPMVSGLIGLCWRLVLI